MSIETLTSEVARAGGNVFIGFKDSAAAAGVDEHGAILATRSVVEEMTSALRTRGVAIQHEFEIIPAIAAWVSPEAVPSLLADPRIEYVEPIFPGRALAEVTSWNVTRVKADSVWGATTGSGAKLLVIDNGADTSHADINYAYISNGCAPGDGLNFDNHGLSVAGIAAATANTIGVIGAAHGAAVYSIDASIGGSEDISPSYATCAVEEGTLTGMDVMNLSFSLNVHTPLTDAINTAYYQHGIVVVGGTGNDGNSEPVLYPANLPAVIAVGGSTANNVLWPGSHTGSKVELVAPGASVLVLCSGQSYCLGTGTSFAAPHVAAAAALLIAFDTSWTAAEIRRRLAVGATDLLPAGRDNSFGFGLLNIKSSLNAPPPDTASVAINGPTLVRPFTQCAWTASVSGGVTPYTYSWNKGSSTASLEYSNTNNHGESFTIVVIVTGADMAVGQKSLLVNVSDSAPLCPS